MFILELKAKEELMPLLKPGICVIKCIGCREIHLPEKKIKEFLDGIKDDTGNILTFDYLCNPDFTKMRREKSKEKIDEANTILVFSCGVGAQVLAKLLEEKYIVQACDTIYLNGWQGLTPTNYTCSQCGECLLNLTEGICPLTQCSKGLLNGPCGGAKEGKCEISKEKDCAWEKIYRRLEERGKLEEFKKVLKVRDYSKMIVSRK